jgi:heterotetrameric sarcosine oxidase gamma subunit
MSGFKPAQFQTTCGSSVDVRPCGSVLEIACRGNPDSALTDILRTFAITLSPDPGCAAGEDPQLIWMAPRRWWLVSDAGKLRVASLAGIAITEIGDAQMRLEVRGDSARDWLSKSCPVDLRRRSFCNGRVAWTVLHESRVLLQCRDDDAFDVYVDRSICQHMIDVLSKRQGIDDSRRLLHRV